MTEASFAGNLTDQPRSATRERQRPVHRRGRGQRVGTEPALDDRQAGQDLQGQRQLATRVAALTIGRSTANGIGRSPTVKSSCFPQSRHSRYQPPWGCAGAASDGVGACNARTWPSWPPWA